MKQWSPSTLVVLILLLKFNGNKFDLPPRYSSVGVSCIIFGSYICACALLTANCIILMCMHASMKTLWVLCVKIWLLNVMNAADWVWCVHIWSVASYKRFFFLFTSKLCPTAVWRSYRLGWAGLACTSLSNTSIASSMSPSSINITPIERV